MRNILKSYRIRKHYHIDIRDGGFGCRIDEKALIAEVEAAAQGHPELPAQQLARCKRHMEAIAKKLDKLRERIEHGQLRGRDEIGLRIGKVINKYKVFIIVFIQRFIFGG